MLITDGIKKGGLDDKYYKEGSRDAELAEFMASMIEASNTKEIQKTTELASFLMALEKPVARQAGQKIPFESFNVWFSPSGLNSDAPGFSAYYSEWTLKKAMDLDVTVFNHTDTEILNARNEGLNLMEKDKDVMAKIYKLYLNRYNLYVRLLALVTGSSLTHKIPAVPTDVNDPMAFTGAFGPLRGENISNIRFRADGITNANHYRAKKSTVLAKEDITDIIDLLESYDDYSGAGIVCLAHPRTVEDLGILYKNDANQDKVIIDGIEGPNFLGADWIKCPQLHKDFIIFVDKGLSNELVIRCQNKDEEQRGLKLVEDDATQGYKYDTGLKLAKMKLFAEEYHVLKRWGVAILDLETVGNADGSMKDASVTKLEQWALQIEAMYNFKALKELNA